MQNELLIVSYFLLSVSEFLVLHSRKDSQKKLKTKQPSNVASWVRGAVGRPTNFPNPIGYRAKFGRPK